MPTRIIELGEEGTINYLGGYDYYMEKAISGSGKSYLEDLGKTVSGSLKENSNDSIASNIGVVDINSESGETQFYHQWKHAAGSRKNKGSKKA